MSRSEVPFGEVVVAVREEIKEAKPNGWQLAYGLIRRIGDRVQFDASVAGREWSQRDAENKFAGQVSRAFAKLTDAGVLRKATAGQPGPDGREVYRNQVAYYTPEMWDAIAAQAVQEAMAEHAVELRAKAVLSRLGALGISGASERSGAVFVGVADMEKLLDLARLGTGLPTHVRYAHPDAGYESSQVQAARYLEPGRVYPLVALQVGQSSSTVELLGLRDLRFSSVMFGPARAEDEDDGPDPA